MAVLREILAKFGVDFDKQAAKDADGAVGGLTSKMKGLISVAAAAVAGGALFNFVREMINIGDEAGKVAIQLGLSTKQLQQWQFAANLAGVKTASFDQSLRLLQKNAFEAGEGVASFADGFDELGVDVKDANGELKTADVLLKDVGLALNNTENSTKRTALALKLMGRTGARLLPLFAGGAEGVDDALSKLEEFGGGLSEDFTAAAQESQDRLAEFGVAVLSFKSRVALFLLPAIDAIVSAMSKAVAAGSKFIQWIHDTINVGRLLQAVLITLGLAFSKSIIARLIAASTAAGRFILANKRLLFSILKVAAKFLFWVLIIDDLIGFLTGAKSATGELLDALFGAGAAESALAGLKKAAVLLGDTFKVVASLVRLFRADTEEEAQKAREALNQAANNILQFWDSVFSALGEALATFGGNVSFIADQIAQSFGVAVGKVASDFAFMFSDIGEGLSNFLVWAGSFFTVFGADTGAVAEGIRDAFKSAVDSIRGFFSGLFASISEGFAFVDNIVNSLSELTGIPKLSNLFGGGDSAEADGLGFAGGGAGSTASVAGNLTTNTTTVDLGGVSVDARGANGDPGAIGRATRDAVASMFSRGSNNRATLAAVRQG